jgi:hypothetical protein
MKRILQMHLDGLPAAVIFNTRNVHFRSRARDDKDLRGGKPSVGKGTFNLIDSGQNRPRCRGTEGDKADKPPGLERRCGGIAPEDMLRVWAALPSSLVFIRTGVALKKRRQIEAASY